MTVFIDSRALYNFETKATADENHALYSKAVEDSKKISKVSVRLATGSIVSTGVVVPYLSLNEL